MPRPAAPARGELAGAGEHWRGRLRELYVSDAGPVSFATHTPPPPAVQ